MRNLMGHVFNMLGILLLAQAHAFTLGAHPLKHKAFESSWFTCFDGSVQVPHSFINDKFCDCADCSDEPGTAASSFGIFYCSNSRIRPQQIHASYVGDGICDCCDGSDERELSCANKCEVDQEAELKELRDKLEAYKEGLAVKLRDKVENYNYEEALKAEVSALKEKAAKTELSLKLAEKYLKFIENNADNFVYVDTLSANNLKAELETQLNDSRELLKKKEKQITVDFGPDKEFISLADICLSEQIGNYLYKLCFFDEVEQIEGGRSFKLGTWKGFNSDYTELSFTEGDACYKRPRRSTTVKMTCGPVMEILSISEPETCVYEMNIALPAVCTPEAVQALFANLNY
mmetsp:Transcript_17305/g.31177  ORF Transcript_17305/g.31177 Transcript_17305/m.31177 type:complete len:347 (-) Transcript_17305:4911-5951(-)